MLSRKDILALKTKNQVETSWANAALHSETLAATALGVKRWVFNLLVKYHKVARP